MGKGQREKKENERRKDMESEGLVETKRIANSLAWNRSWNPLGVFKGS